MTLDFLIDAEAWKLEAACRDADHNLFFPELHQHQQAKQVAMAKAICSTCPVTAECLDYANQTLQPYGIWGGLSPKERRGTRKAGNPRGRIVNWNELAALDGLPSPEAARILGVSPSTVRQNRRQMAVAFSGFPDRE